MIGSWLLSTFKSRYKEVLTKAHTAVFAASSKYLALLSKEETKSEIFVRCFVCLLFPYLIFNASLQIHINIIPFVQCMKQLNPL